MFGRSLLCTLLLASTSFAQITFTKASYSPFSGSVAVGDFDRDGRPDVASLSFVEGGDGLLVIYKGIAGGISKKVQYDIPTAMDAVAIYTADLNHDGNLDIVFTKEFTPELEIWYGNGDATFTFGQVLNINSPSPTVGLGDVNRDGAIDIVTSEPGDTHSGSWVYLNNGSGGFTRGAFVEAPRFVDNFALADLNRDGKLDILFRTVDQFVLFKGNGDGTFTAGPTTPFTADPGSMVIGSFNHDSSLDLAYRIPKCSTCSTDTVYVYLNDGSGHFTLKSTNNIGLSQVRSDSMAAGDLNNDGVMDLFYANNGGTTNSLDKAIVYVLNKGDGSFSTQVKAASMPGTTALPVLRHFSKDSQLDVIAPSAQVVILFGKNAPTICTPPSSATLATNICGPSSNANVSKTFTVRAAGDSPAGVGRMELWIDGKKAYEVWGDQLKRTVTVSAGTHRVVVQSFDIYTGLAKRAIYVNAQ